MLEPDEVLVERVGREGWAVASSDGVTVALDTALDDELRLEGRLYDRIHEVNVLRKESGLEVTDRIRLWLPDADLLERFADRLAAETLASIELAVGRAAARTNRALTDSVYGGLRVGERELAAQLDRQAELDVLVDEPVRLDLLHAAGAEPVADALDELLGRRGARRDADDLDAVDPAPRRSRSRRRSGATATPRARRLDEAVRVRRVARADHEQQVDLAEHLLDRPLAVRGRVTDVFLLRRVDRRGSGARSAAMISPVSSTESVVCVT